MSDQPDKDRVDRFGITDPWEMEVFVPVEQIEEPEEEEEE